MLRKAMREGRVWPLLMEAWKLLRGSASHRFAIVLVRCGALLVAGPSLYLVLALGALDRLSPQQNYLDAALSLGAFCTGLALLVTGVWVFHRHHGTVVLADDFKISVPNGWPFDHVAKQIVSDKVVIFENFQPGHLRAPLRGQDVTCGSALNALRLLGYLAVEPGFPQYTVHEDAGHVTLRAEDVEPDVNADPAGR